MDIETIKIIKIIGEVKPKKNADIDINNAATRFMCMPGSRPVIVPARIPMRMVMDISRSMDLKGEGDL